MSLKSLISLLFVAQTLAAPWGGNGKGYGGPHALSAATSNGQTVTVGGINYFVPKKPVARATRRQWQQSLGAVAGLIPVTIMKSPCSDFSATTADFAKKDDVWSSSFLGAVVSRSSYSCRAVSKYTVLQLPRAAVSSLPEGPYFLSYASGAAEIYQAYRLYNDYSFSFYVGVIPDQAGAYEVMTGQRTETDGSTTIAVPSRLYFPAASASKPFSGVRLGVKDLYDISGVRTSEGNRAWYHLYPPANDTAVAVQRLVDLGAIIVGKTRTSQFANGEQPTADWVDYHDPFNPRGDGYGDPSSSSAGAGSAEASYPWIDMNVGSDTGGSVRAPAAYSSLYGNRPSIGAISTEGVLSMSPEMDTLAFVARSADDFARWGKAWYAENPDFKSYSAFPKKLIYPIDTPGINSTAYPSPGFFPSSYNASQPLYDAFVSALEKILGVEKTMYDFYTEYKDTSGTDLYPPDHVGEVWTKLTCYEQAHNVWNPFFADYQAENNGDSPHLDPPVLRNYQYGLNQTDADYARILDEKAAFLNWTRTKLLVSDFKSDSCSNAVLVNPIFTGDPTTRQGYFHAPTADNVYLGWNRYGVSQLAGVPEVVMPLGTVPYQSDVTNTVKQSPMAVSLLAGYGCDFMLFDLVKKLAEAGAIPATVKTGEVL